MELEQLLKVQIRVRPDYQQNYLFKIYFTSKNKYTNNVSMS